MEPVTTYGATSNPPVTDGSTSASVTATVSPQIEAADINRIDHPDVYTPYTRAPRARPVEVMKQPRNNMEKVARINMYLHRRRSNSSVNQIPKSAGVLEPPGQCCQSRACSFCTGPLLQQRYCLLQRLYQLNTSLYGAGYANDLLQDI